MRRGPLQAGEKVQFTDRRGKKITDQLVPGGTTPDRTRPDPA